MKKKDGIKQRFLNGVQTKGGCPKKVCTIFAKGGPRNKKKKKKPLFGSDKKSPRR